MAYDCCGRANFFATTVIDRHDGRPSDSVHVPVLRCNALLPTPPRPSAAAPGAGDGRHRVASGKEPRLGLIETTDTTPVEVRVNGRLFVIPHNYFRYPPLPGGAEDTGFVLRVLLPDLTPYTAETADEFRRGGHGRKMNILLEGRQRIRPLGELFNNLLQGAAASPPSTATFGLAHGYNRYDGDFFAYERKGYVAALIRCDVYKHDYAPSCRHLFLWSDFYIQLSYGREHLQEWCNIEQQVKTFLRLLLKFPIDKQSDDLPCR